MKIATSMSTAMWREIYLTFLASIRSVGTACTLAGVGIYLHRRGFILGDGKRTLALISQQVTIPLLFFTKFINCNQDWSTDPCPDVTQSLRDVWMLLIWPLYVVGVGLTVGYFMAKISGAPKHQMRAVLAACGFGNSTGLPITLLTVVHANFPSTTDLGRVDPCLFLSVYLLLYPVLQWGIGGWLLAPPENKGENEESFTLEEAKRAQAKRRRSSRFAHNVLNTRTDSMYKFIHRGMGETDASMYMSVQDNLNQKFGGAFEYTRVKPEKELPTEESAVGLDLAGQNDSSIGLDLSAQQQPEQQREDVENQDSPLNENSALLPKYHSADDNMKALECSQSSSSSASDDYSTDEETLMETIQKVAKKCFQPPVIGALLGLIVASMPRIRGLFVDLIDRNGDAPLEWFFDGLYAAGQAAVPINMIILGCNLSASYANTNIKDEHKTELFSPQTSAAIVFGKMVAMPIIGFLSAFFFKTYFWNIPDEINGSFYLVILIVFLTPTANNVMVMVELGGGGSREAIARVIAWQYAAAPVILSLTMTAAVGLADQWS